MDDWKLQPAHDINLPLSQRLKSPRRESGLLGTIAHLAFWSVVRPYLSICHRLRVIGAEHLPVSTPFVIASNHASHLDALVLASLIPPALRDQVFPIAAGDTFFETPIARLFAAGALNALPLWRKNVGAHGLAQLRRRLVEDGCGYVLFPEGTRSRDGRLGRFKAGLGMIVAGTHVPVIPALLQGSFDAMPPGRRVPRWRLITLQFGPPVSFPNVPDTRQGWEAVARDVEARVAGMAGDRAPHTPPAAAQQGG